MRACWEAERARGRASDDEGLQSESPGTARNAKGRDPARLLIAVDRQICAKSLHQEDVGKSGHHEFFAGSVCSNLMLKQFQGRAAA
jgi:hypothetical protein